jgi:hypothetical protein
MSISPDHIVIYGVGLLLVCYLEVLSEPVYRKLRLQRHTFFLKFILFFGAGKKQ